MFEFHKDKQVYFDYQYQTSKNFIIPFLKGHLDFEKKLNILEIGCAEGGVLKAFSDMGHQCTGIELNPGRIKLAAQFFEKEIKEGIIKLINKNIYDIDPKEDLDEKFDLIVLKDVIEHIPRQERLIFKLREFLKSDGKIFFAFPPWQMPFGGHQQICDNKLLSMVPYFHLLPKNLYKKVLNIFKEKDRKVEELLELKDAGISIERFEGIVKNNHFNIVKRAFFLINPIYKYKFNLKPRYQFQWIAGLPYVRNFFTTAVYYLIGDK